MPDIDWLENRKLWMRANHHLASSMALPCIQMLMLGSRISIRLDCTPGRPPPSAKILPSRATAARLPLCSDIGAICTGQTQ